ncbi:Rieske (2Fe-2S) protein [Bradyrhizobium sp. KB893862 SZCCT0404]|nr:Rieske (2Fe-2S) protein [Bradyrhizobium sp. KB893862 SZCCT0404]MBR1177017.1 Rieske (2Fe-2S) protein [Bradyrhizobium sp. KB893862 SZCCT0404]
MREYAAGPVAEYADGDRRVFVCGEHEVGIFRVEGQFYAWHNRCAHRSGPVCQGRILNRVIEPVDEGRMVRSLEYDETEPQIVCPWHGYEFSIKTGYHQGNSRIRLLKVETLIRDGELYVRL